MIKESLWKGMLGQRQSKLSAGAPSIIRILISIFQSTLDQLSSGNLDHPAVRRAHIGSKVTVGKTQQEKKNETVLT